MLLPESQSLLDGFISCHADVVSRFKQVSTPNPVVQIPPSLVIAALTAVDDLVSILAQMRACLSQTLNRATLRGTSFGALSLELMQQIIDSAVKSPHDRANIIKLSHVSQYFRSAVLGMSHLFVSANYAWPTAIIDTWCSRAGSRPLTIAVPVSVSETSVDVTAEASIRLSRASVIHLHVLTSRNDRDIPLKSLVTQLLPMVHTLSLTSEDMNPHSPHFNDLSSSSFPSLRSLYIPNASCSVINGPFTQLRDIGVMVCDTETLERFIKVVSGVTSLEHLTLYGSFRSHRPCASYPQSEIKTLNSLRSLRMMGYSMNNIKAVNSIIRSFIAPGLQILELVECDYTILSCFVTLHVYSTFGDHVTHIVISRLFGGPASEFLRHLYDNDGGIPFPELHSLAIQDGSRKDMQEQDALETEYWPSLSKLVGARRRKLNKLMFSVPISDACRQSLHQYNIEVTSSFELDDYGLPPKML
ncbi:hypothetical protein DL93DRAFT_2088328 [Clavulina sp. PMI_390]|nr:hypothetical protein DL93DRAFT_2088328 [Clavulina sp. PMI_390]